MRWHALVLAPHPDDAVFSCGGAIRRRAESGQNVLVLTVCAGEPPPTRDLSPFALRLHGRWLPGGPGNERSPIPVHEVRRAEDARAVSGLGATVEWWDVPDAIYRRDAAGGWPYAAERDLFGRPHPSDEGLARRLAERLGGLAGIDRGTVIFAPLAVGGHVDHRLVRRAATRWRGAEGVWLYEDYPYAADRAAVRRALRSASRRRSWTVALDEGQLAAKIDAMGCYGSQLSTFWRDRRSMADEVRKFAAETGSGTPAERCWRVRPPGR